MIERRHARIAGWLLCLVAGVAAAAPAKETPLTPISSPIRGFSFGPEKTPRWPGFIAVDPKSAYSPQAGFGWDKPSDLFYSTDFGQYDPLTRYCCCYTRGDVTFSVDLKNGKYLATLVYGSLREWPAINPYRISLQGKLVVDWQPNEAEYYRHWQLGWWPGESAWKYMADRFRVETFPVEVSTGRLDVLMCQYSFINALLVTPADHDLELKAALREIERDRRRAFEARWPYQGYSDVADDLSPKTFTPAAADRDRGYTLFPRWYDRAALPESRPAPQELTARIEIAAALDEAAPATVCFLPHRDFAKLEVRLSDLAGPDGAAIPARAATVYRVRYKETVWGSSSPGWFSCPRMLDEISMKASAGGCTGEMNGWLRPYPKNTLTRIWLTFRAPADAKPGDYRGQVTVTPDGAAAASIDVRLRVHPFQLQEPDNIHFSMVHNPRYGMSYVVAADAKRYLWYLERDCRFLYDLGARGLFTVLSPRVTWKEDEPSLDFSEYNGMVDVMRKTGLAPILLNYYTSGAYYAKYDPAKGSDLDYLDKEMKLDPGFMKRITAYCRALAAESKRVGWPTTYFSTMDEASNYGERGCAVEGQIAQAMKAGGVLTFGTENGPGQLNFLDVIDLPVMNYAAPLNEATLEKVRKAGRPIGLYNLAWTDRFAWGLYSWRIGAYYRTDWHFRKTTGDPYNEFDGNDAATIAYPTPERLIPTPFSEQIREGIKDGWYLRMLEKELAKAPADSPSALKGRALLDRLRQRIPEQYSQYWEPARSYDPPKAKFSITPEELEAIRGALADAIAQLRAEQKRRAAP